MITEISLNEYIKHYLEKDFTPTAILLSGEWGSGKSFYVENKLTPFLIKHGHDVVVVSLYGIEDLFALSRSIYIESKLSKTKQFRDKAYFQCIKSHKKGLRRGSVVASTVAKNVAKNLFHIDIDVSDKALKKLYDSVDLSGKLLVLEDIERSNIDILKVLGFVNNLVEQDHVKVLLVANESKLLHIKRPSSIDVEAIVAQMFKEQQAKKENIPEEQVDEEVDKYLEAKEKTIGDTIIFQLPQQEAVAEIVGLFNNSILTEIFHNELQSKVIDIVQSVCMRNLRIFIYATQKAVDIFEKMNYEESQKDFYICVWISAIYYLVRERTNKDYKWSDEKVLSTKLGCNEYPLPRFLYEYIINQTYDENAVEEAIKSYRNYRLYENEHNNISDGDYSILSDYYLHTDFEVKNAMDSIAIKLQKPDYFPVTIYGRLAFYIIVVGSVIGYDTTIIKGAMCKNMEHFAKDIDSIEDVFLRHYTIPNAETLEQYVDFVNELKGHFNENKKKDYFSYRPEDIAVLYEDTYRKKGIYVANHRFISEFDVEKLVEMLSNSSASQIDKFRGVLFLIYRDTSIGFFDKLDSVAFEKLDRGVKELLDGDDTMDCIKKLQLKWLCENVKDFLGE